MWKTITRAQFALIGQALRNRNEGYEWLHAYPTGWDHNLVTVKLTEQQWALFPDIKDQQPITNQ
jgi:hypothetical protein